MKKICGNEEDSISVIIPFYIGAAWLEEAIESVLAQTLLPDEIIVINDGSKENINSLESKYADKVRFVYQKNQGAGRARNHGIQLSRGKYIAFLDSDDLWLPNKLEVQLKYMKENNLLWSHCPYDVFEDGTRKVIKQIDNHDTEGMMFPQLLACCKIATPCVMIRADCVNMEMLFNEEMRQGQDYCFWNVLAKKYSLGNVGSSLVLVRDHGNNVAYSAFNHLRTKKRIFDYVNANKDYFGVIPIPLRFAFFLSNAGYRIVSILTSIITAKTLQEIAARTVYIIPWGAFHVYYRIANMMQRNIL